MAQLAEQLVVPPKPEVGFDALFEHRQPELLNAGQPQAQYRSGLHVDQRRSAPEVQRLAEERGRRLDGVALQRLAPQVAQPPRLVQVEFSLLDSEQVPAIHGHQQSVHGCATGPWRITQSLPQLHHVGLQCRHRAGRRSVAPQLLDALRDGTTWLALSSNKASSWRCFGADGTFSTPSCRTVNVPNNPNSTDLTLR